MYLHNVFANDTLLQNKWRMHFRARCTLLLSEYIVCMSTDAMHRASESCPCERQTFQCPFMHIMAPRII